MAAAARADEDTGRRAQDPLAHAHGTGEDCDHGGPALDGRHLTPLGPGASHPGEEVPHPGQHGARLADPQVGPLGTCRGAARPATDRTNSVATRKGSPFSNLTSSSPGRSTYQADANHIAARSREQREILGELLGLDRDSADLRPKRREAIWLLGQDPAWDQCVGHGTSAQCRHRLQPLTSRAAHGFLARFTS